MRLLEDLTLSKTIPASKTVVALGVFDGLHCGHQAVVRKAVCYKQIGLSPCVFTFETKSVTSKGNLELLISNKQKTEMFEKLGVEYYFCPDFNDIKNLTAEEFIRDIVAGKLNAGATVCGENFHFGKGGKAGCYELMKLCNKYNIKCEIVPFTTFNGLPVSSTLIRESIKSGEIEKANTMLGYDYNFTEKVVGGNKIGRTLDFPTINQYFEDKHVIPKFGVYASNVIIDNKVYKGVSNIGVKPTIGHQPRPLCETYIIGIDEDLYGKEVTVVLKKFMRPETKFCSLSELKAHIASDLLNVKNYFDNKL